MFSSLIHSNTKNTEKNQKREREEEEGKNTVTITLFFHSSISHLTRISLFSISFLRLSDLSSHLFHFLGNFSSSSSSFLHSSIFFNSPCSSFLLMKLRTVIFSSRKIFISRSSHILNYDYMHLIWF